MAKRGRPAKNTAPVYNWAVEGLTRCEKTVGFKVGNLELVAKYSPVSFGANMAVGTQFFGSIEKLLAAAEAAVNDAPLAAAKQAAKSGNPNSHLTASIRSLWRFGRQFPRIRDVIRRHRPQSAGAERLMSA